MAVAVAVAVAVGVIYCTYMHIYIERERERERERVDNIAQLQSRIVQAVCSTVWYEPEVNISRGEIKASYLLVSP